MGSSVAMRCGTLAVLLALGCGSGEAGPDAGPTFVAFASSFQPFRTWTSFHSDGPAPGTFPDDVLGPRTQYISALPPHGSTVFPVGTMIVEVRENVGKIFAGVKRGGGFNSTGARDWEWFELQETNGNVSVQWRGVGPPKGEVYGGDPTGGCNACHQTFAGNDYVASPYLQLATF